MYTTAYNFQGLNYELKLHVYMYNTTQGCAFMRTLYTHMDVTNTADMISKELGAHKEMVAELRKQLVEKENELQVYILYMYMYMYMLMCMCVCMYMYMYV